MIEFHSPIAGCVTLSPLLHVYLNDCGTYKRFFCFLLRIIYDCLVWNIFQDWIAPVPSNPLKARCRYCRVRLNAHLSDLRKHLATSKHTRNAAKHCNPETESVARNHPPAADGLCHVLSLESVLFQFTEAFLLLLPIYSYVCTHFLNNLSALTCRQWNSLQQNSSVLNWRLLVNASWSLYWP